MTKLYIGSGQEHLEGVLWLSDTETVLAFSSSSNMMAASCHFAEAMNWHGKPVRLHIQPPMTVQVRDYNAMWSSHPFGTQTPVQGEGMDTQPLPSKPHLDNRPQTELTTRDIWNLDNDQLRDALEAVQFMTARREGFCTPHS